MAVISVSVGNESWSIEVPEGVLIASQRETPPSTPITNLRTTVKEAMEHPVGLDFPLRKAFTPEDRVAIVLDENLPHLAELLSGVLEYLAGIGIALDAVTVISPCASTRQGWIDDLPDDFADVHTEEHQPDDRKRLSYLSATKHGHRIYLNRTLVDADQAIILSGRRYDPLLGYSGAEGMVYPLLADRESVRLSLAAFSADVPGPTPRPSHSEAQEIAWLLGTPIYLQAIEGFGDSIIQVLAATGNGTAEGIRQLDRHWRISVPQRVEVVIATLSGDPRGHDFAALARAAMCAARVVDENGAIVILSDAEPTFSAGIEQLRRFDQPAEAVKWLMEHKPLDYPALLQWTSSAVRSRLFLASHLAPMVVEELFAVPIANAAEVQRLVASAKSCVVIPDAHKSLAEVNYPSRGPG